jgi:hypothetical protein
VAKIRVLLSHKKMFLGIFSTNPVIAVYSFLPDALLHTRAIEINLNWLISDSFF